ncbi:MAG: alpha/beta hydrolase, partial [Verrucomicrobiales bacterium]
YTGFLSRLALGSGIAVLVACTSPKPLTLMPTPILYTSAKIDPFAHMGEVHRSPAVPVFYATNRVPASDGAGVTYRNKLGPTLHLGRATIRVGEAGASWPEVVQASLAGANQGGDTTPLVVTEVAPLAAVPIAAATAPGSLSPELQAYVDAINAELAGAVDKEIVVYVHGTKVDFTNSVSLTAEIDHFAGRDFVGVAFAWPSHQDILSYMVGVDVQRALDSSAALHRLLQLLADHTDAKHINVLAYSAGGRVTSKALHEMRQAYPELTGTPLRKRFRLGAVAFAAADVPVDTFLERLPNVSALAELVVITISDNDTALKAGKNFMGGLERAGTRTAENEEEDFVTREKLSNVEIIDVSFGQEVRGFDITGHHYWYRHPWTSSDMVFLMRTDLPAGQRGLSPTEQEGIWFLSSDYPTKIRQAAKSALDGQW